MSDITLDEVLKLVKQLSSEDQEALFEYLANKHDSFEEVDLLIFDVGAWPDNLTLKREDEYGDDGRYSCLDMV